MNKVVMGTQDSVTDLLTSFTLRRSLRKAMTRAKRKKRSRAMALLFSSIHSRKGYV